MTDFIDFLDLWSYNAIYNFVDTVRNTGKTTRAKAWVLARFIKRGKKCLWVRTFEDDVATLGKDFYTEKKSQAIKICNKWGYKVSANDIVQQGEYIYYINPKTGKKAWFIHIVHLSQTQSLKGNEIPECDLIVYDEYRTPTERINRYIGNQAVDFINLVVTISRDHYVRCLLLGNKESFNNPFYDYLRIRPPKESFEGIKTYKHGSIAIMQSNHVPDAIASNSMTRKQQQALADTPMYDYLFKGATNGIVRDQIKRLPGNTVYYAGFDISTGAFSAFVDWDGNFYFKTGLDATRHVYVDSYTNKYKRAERIYRGDKKKFKLLMNAVKHNKVYFCDASVYERAGDLLRLLGA